MNLYLLHAQIVLNGYLLLLAIDETQVRCGDHSAITCSACTQGPRGVENGEEWCNGECQWASNISNCVTGIQ